MLCINLSFNSLSFKSYILGRTESEGEFIPDSFPKFKDIKIDLQDQTGEFGLHEGKGQ